MSMKNPLTPAGIEPATFRFVAQHLNHCATAVPSWRVLSENSRIACGFALRSVGIFRLCERLVDFDFKVK